MSTMPWSQMLCICIALICMTARTTAESSPGLFNRDAVEGRPPPETTRMLYEARTNFEDDVIVPLALTMSDYDAANDDAISIDSVERFNGHSYRALPLAVQELRKKDGKYSTGAMDPLDGQFYFSIFLSIQIEIQ